MWNTLKAAAVGTIGLATIWMPRQATAQSEGLTVRIQGGYEALGAHLEDGPVARAAIGRRWSREFELTGGVSAKLYEEPDVCLLDTPDCANERIVVDMLSVSITGRYFLTGVGGGPFQPFVAARAGYERLIRRDKNGVGVDGEVGFDYGVFSSVALTVSAAVGYVAAPSPPRRVLETDLSGTRVGLHAGIRWVL